MRHGQLRSGIGTPLLLASLFATTALATQQSWQVVGQIGGQTRAVTLQGHYAYAAAGARLAVVDTTNPSDLRELGVTRLFPNLVEDLAVSGTTAYVAAGAAGLRFVDVSDPASPAEIAAWESRGYAQSVAVAGSIAYLADGPYGLRLIDVSNRAHPAELGAAYPSSYAFDVAVQGRYAYIAAAGAGLLIADVADPRRPIEAGSLATAGYAFGVAVAGTIAYVADGWGGLAIVNVADPAHPVQVGLYQAPGWVLDVAVSGTNAYLADAIGGLRIVDVSDPARPRHAGAFAPAGRIDCKKLAVGGDVAYLADPGAGIRAVRISNPQNLVQVGTYGAVPYARDVALSGNLALVAAGWGGVRIVDVADPARPKEVATYDVKVEADRIGVAGTTACVKAGADVGETDDSRLRIFDIANPAKPVALGAFAYPQPVNQAVAIEDGLLYTTDEFGLAVISIRDPAHPTQLGYTAVTGAWGFAVDRRRAYVAATHRGFNILDVPEKGDPQLLGSIPMTQARDVAVAGALAYVAVHGFGLHVISVADPLHPSIVGSAGLEPSEALSVALAGDTAFIASGLAGVMVFDVTHSAAPRLSGWVETAGYAFAVAAQSDRLFVADGPGGLVILERETASAADAKPATRGGTAPAPLLLPPRRAPGAEAGGAALTRTVSALASDCVVKTTADSGDGSLWQCLEIVAAGSTIRFDPSVFPAGKPATILARGLPALGQGNVTIDASDAGVILDGSNAPPNASGLNIASSGNVVRGLQIVNFQNAGIALTGSATNNTIGGDRGVGSAPTGQGCVISGNGYGINISGAGVSGNVVEGNFIGTTADGMRAMPNRWFGLFVMDSSQNRIGGNSPGRSNVISATPTGIDIQRFHASGNHVTGNIIGLAVDGRTELPNQYGVTVQLGASANRIEKNVISGNAEQAVVVVDERSCYNVIAGNLIGTDAAGLEARANRGAVTVQHDVLQGWNLFGGKTAGERNVISGSPGGMAAGGTEIFVVGNFFGTDGHGARAIGGSGGLYAGGPHSFVERNLISASRSSGLTIGGKGCESIVVAGNYVGTDATGRAAVPNAADGIVVDLDARRTFLQNNLVSGNAGSGVRIRSGPGHRLRGNRIGTTANGDAALGNAMHGVNVEGASNAIGGTQWGDGNVIAHNAGSGVLVSEQTNLIAGNSIFGNGKGIRLMEGANGRVSAPLLWTASSNSVSGQACAGCRVELFSDSADQGRVYEGSAVADGAGFFTLTTPWRLAGPNATATATDGEGNTSEFSAPRELPPPPLRRRVTRP